MDDCLFCRIISKKVNGKFEYEDDSLVAIQDINPQAPVHLLVIPRKHIAQVGCIEKTDAGLLGDMVFCAKELARQKNAQDYRLVFNNGTTAGQSVFHIHLHLLGGRSMNWPPG